MHQEDHIVTLQINHILFFVHRKPEPDDEGL